MIYFMKYKLYVLFPLLTIVWETDEDIFIYINIYISPLPDKSTKRNHYNTIKPNWFLEWLHNALSLLISLCKDFEVINISSNLSGEVATTINKTLIPVSLFSLTESVRRHCLHQLCHPILPYHPREIHWICNNWSQIYFSEVSLSAFLQMVWAEIQFVSGKFFTHNNQKHTPEGQIKSYWWWERALGAHPHGRWLEEGWFHIFHSPPSKTPRSCRSPRLTLALANMILVPVVPTIMHQWCPVNINPFLKHEEPHKLPVLATPSFPALSQQLLPKAVVFRDFPGSPVVKTPHFHCRGRRFHPWSGKFQVWSKNK